MNNENQLNLEEPTSENHYTARSKSKCQEIGTLRLQKDTFSVPLKPTFLRRGQSEMKRQQGKWRWRWKVGKEGKKTEKSIEDQNPHNTQ